MAYPPNNALKRPYAGSYPSPWDAPRPPKDPRLPNHDSAFYTSTGQNWGESISHQYNYFSSGYPNYTPPSYAPPPPPSNNKTSANLDFTDDYSAFYDKSGYQPRGGTANQRGSFGFKRGGANNNRGSNTGNSFRGRGGYDSSKTSNQSDQSRGGGQQKRGGNQTGGRGQQNRGRGRGQRGMPPNSFNNPRGRGRGGNKPTSAPVVPPVHSLAKAKPEILDIENMSTAEKLHRFCLFLRSDDCIKVNGIQTIMNGITSSKLRLKADFETEELVREEGKCMYTGVLKLDDVFLARAVMRNKKDLKQKVFSKALNVMLTMTVAEIYNLVDPGLDVMRDEMKKHILAAEEEQKNKKAEQNASQAEALCLVEADSETTLSQLINALTTMKTLPDSPISVIEQASSQGHTIIRPEYKFESLKLPNNRPYTLGKITLGPLVIGRGNGSTRKASKFDTFKKTLERLKTKSMAELLESVPPESIPEMVLSVPSINVVNKKASELSLEKRFSEMILKVSTSMQKFSTSSIMQMDCAAMQNGLTPMLIMKNDPKLMDKNTIQCDLYLEKIFMSSGEAKSKRDSAAKAYTAAWEVLTTTSVSDILTNHRRITEAEMNEPHQDILVKGAGHGVESNAAGLRKHGFNVNEIDHRQIKDLIILEHSDWSLDRVRNSFCILQSSCSQCGLHMQWEHESVNALDTFKCVISIQKEKMGESYGKNKNHARNLAASDALFKLYETQDVIKVCRRVDDDKKWITWESILEASEKLRSENVGEEPIVKTDEHGNTLPDTFVMKVLSEELEKYTKKEEKEELLIGPGMRIPEARELRNRTREMGLRCDALQNQDNPYTLIYEKLNWPDLIAVLKKTGKPYGKYMLVERENLPKHADIKNNIEKELLGEETKVTVEIA